MKLRLLQFNYLDGGTKAEGSSPWDQQISDIIVDSGADIAVLCETNDPHSKPPAERFTAVADRLPPDFVARRQFTYPANRYPLAIVAKFPLISWQAWDGSNSGADIRKVIFEAQLDVSGTPVFVFGYHAWPRKDEEGTEIRVKEAEFLSSQLDARSGQLRFAIGDFNTIAEGEGERDDGRITNLMREAGYIDCYREVYPDIAAHRGQTVVKNPNRIDYIFRAGDVAGMACTECVVYTKLPERATAFPSDHYALYADIVLRAL
jgi:endonuclease/exonuclease/phosphatase family metal-dependent hydrolase